MSRTGGISSFRKKKKAADSPGPRGREHRSGAKISVWEERKGKGGLGALGRGEATFAKGSPCGRLLKKGGGSNPPSGTTRGGIVCTYFEKR